MEVKEKKEKITEPYINDENTKRLFGEWNKFLDIEKMKEIDRVESEQKLEQMNINSVKILKKMNFSDEMIAKILSISVDDVDKYYKKFQKGAK